MTDLNPPSDKNQTPEDVATLYSWANLHGTKYRDFSAARAQTRETARLRAEQALEEERRRSQEPDEAAKAREAEQAGEEARVEEAGRQTELVTQQALEQAAQRVAQRTQEQTARMEAEQAARQAAQEAEWATQQAVQRAQEQAAQLAAQQAAERAAEQAAEQAAQQRAWQQRTDRFAAGPVPAPPPPVFPAPLSFENAGYSRPQAYRPAPAQPQYAPARDEAPMPARHPWATLEMREPAVRPAWLGTENPETPGAQGALPPLGRPPAPPPLPQAPAPLPQALFSQPPLVRPPLPQSPEDALQGSRDRLTSRWFALRGVFDGAPAQPEPIPAPMVSRAPAMAVFSLAGGVGKTSLVATLGRALAARGERVLLVDTAAFGLLPFFFGATDQRPGKLRTFSPPGVSSDAPVQMVTIDPEGLGPEQGGQESLSGEIAKFSRGASRVIVDLATASGATTRRIMRMAPLVLVPVVPDMNSVVSVSSIDAFFEHNSIQAGKPALPYYVLNQFDATLPLHLDVREVLREQLADRLLPFALRRAPAMSEALAEGMTVMDYAPGSGLAEDFATLAGWVKSLSAPAMASYRGVRWSER